MKSAEPERVVVRNCNPLVRRLRSFQNDVAAHLMHLRVLPATAQDIREMHARDVAWDFHATDSISSRTRWRRIRSGRGRSKKNAVVASTTFLRNCSHVSPSVKMFSVRHSAQ